MLSFPLARTVTAALALVGVAAAGCAGDAPGPAASAGPERQVEAAAVAGPAWPVAESPGLGGAGAVGQSVYVPVYSHIFSQDGGREVDLAVTLSVRNTDPARSITVAPIRYYDSAGRLVRTYEGGLLGPLASRAYVVDEGDRTGGVGANFVVQWEAEGAVSPPVVEGVMISTASSQGISFVSRGRVVRPLGESR